MVFLIFTTQLYQYFKPRPNSPVELGWVGLSLRVWHELRPESWSFCMTGSSGRKSPVLECGIPYDPTGTNPLQYILENYYFQLCSKTIYVIKKKTI